MDNREFLKRELNPRAYMEEMYLELHGEDGIHEVERTYPDSTSVTLSLPIGDEIEDLTDEEFNLIKDYFTQRGEAHRASSKETVLQSFTVYKPMRLEMQTKEAKNNFLKDFLKAMED